MNHDLTEENVPRIYSVDKFLILPIILYHFLTSVAISTDPEMIIMQSSVHSNTGVANFLSQPWISSRRSERTAMRRVTFSVVVVAYHASRTNERFNPGGIHRGCAPSSRPSLPQWLGYRWSAKHSSDDISSNAPENGGYVRKPQG
ncbi:hypothetical protein EK21DRAFT_88578 [Setomelanomma holmii]|uniref:Uncharacterized protein n=1 Tax=Setomelanomma holmii TaxID=210430 RepID=A0A9P4HD39_9PLEO|nr:hypothetical protein EK21DRAFT_88578 [Setomelanomma holmii]